MMHIITENLLVENNKFGFAFVENGYFTEQDSIFDSKNAVNDKNL